VKEWVSSGRRSGRVKDGARCVKGADYLRQHINFRCIFFTSKITEEGEGLRNFLFWFLIFLRSKVIRGESNNGLLFTAHRVKPLTGLTGVRQKGGLRLGHV
jgi:hypothetical protein